MLGIDTAWFEHTMVGTYDSNTDTVTIKNLESVLNAEDVLQSINQSTNNPPQAVYSANVMNRDIIAPVTKSLNQLLSALNGKEDKSNKATEIEADNTDEQYASAKAVYNFGVAILAEVKKMLENVNLNKLDNTVTFLTDGELYETMSVKQGNSINAPATEPTSEEGSFAGWQLNEETINFPYTPTSNIEVNALFGTTADLIYSAYGISKTDYPYIMITINNFQYKIYMYFCKDISTDGNQVLANAPYLLGSASYYAGSTLPFEWSDVESMAEYIMNKKIVLNEQTTNLSKSLTSSDHTYINFDKGSISYTTYKI
jgi:hypothetical protein